ncbi:MAG: NAD(+) kinase, partial [Calothrix sp. SM1_5_4]|nr:NAD(+) kinase [Calothrix sp. SM1_5_4]
MAATKALKLFKQDVRKVLIVYRRATPEAARLAKELGQWLKERKIRVFSHPSQTLPGATKLTRGGDVDLVVVLGGDGTYLEAVRILDGRRIPVLGFNMGSLGFLTVHRAQDLFPMVQLALEGRLEIKRRSMIRVQVRSGAKVKLDAAALNDSGDR